MNSQESGHESVLEEIARVGGEGVTQPFKEVDPLYGYLWREGGGTGTWRLYRDLYSGDYLRGPEDVVFAQRSLLTLGGDTVLYVARGSELTLYQKESNSHRPVGSGPGDDKSTPWHIRNPREWSRAEP